MERKRQMRGDDSGQMMLLAAVILVLGFIALAGMLARAQQLGAATSKEQARPIRLEIGALKTGLDGAITSLTTSVYGFKTDTEPHKQAYESAITGILEHERRLEASRGFLLEYKLACATAADPATGYAAVTLTDGELWVQLRTRTFVRPTLASSCTPAPVPLPP